MQKILSIVSFILLLVTLSYAAPVISPNPAVAVFVTGAYVTWTTTESGASSVDYGTTTSYGSSVSSGSDLTNENDTIFHAYTITGLLENTTYHYKVTTGATESSDFTFTTLTIPSTGTVRTVGTSKTYSTVASCISASSAGDTCLCYTGTPSTAVTPRSGSAGSGYFTVMANDAVTISGFTISGLNYVAVRGFKSVDLTSASTSTYITIDNNYFEGASGNIIDVEDLQSSSWWRITNNVLHNGGYKGILLPGTYHLISNNDISDLPNDFIYNGYMQYSVVRNNSVHDFDCGSNCGVAQYHMDFFQWDGYGSLPLRYVLIENNDMLRWIDPTGNTHWFISRGDETAPQNIIFRHNIAMVLSNGAGFTLGSGENNLAYRMYNNTLAAGSKSDQSFYSSYYANYTKSRNNIAYESETNGNGPWDSGTGIDNDYNIAYNSGYSGEWDARYTAESTYNTFKNQDPSFSNYPYDASIPSDSFAVDKGSHLTTVSSGCNSTTLTFADVRWFQPGWAGTDGDTVKIGATVAGATEALITGVNYNANANIPGGTVTFGSSVSCTNNDSVWLYKDSDGTVVLAGTAPDVGAYEYGVTVEEEVVPANAIQGVTIN